GRFSECTRDVIAVPEVPTALVTSASMTLCSCRTPAGSAIRRRRVRRGLGRSRSAWEHLRVADSAPPGPAGVSAPDAPPPAGPSWAGILGRLTAGDDLGRGQAAWVMEQIMSGAATPAQIAAFGVAMKMKGPRAAEVSELAEVMLRHA